MKIRTITTGVQLDALSEVDKIKEAAEFNKTAQEAFEKEGYEVQTTRVATNSWEDYMGDLSDDEIVSEVQKIEEIGKDLDVSFLNIGYAKTPEKIAVLSAINKVTSIISCSATVGNVEDGVNFEAAKAAAKVVKEIADGTENGYGNFRFCSSANCKPGIPFFPTGFHEGETTFRVGLECGDLAMKAFSKSNNLQEAEENLKAIFEEELKKVQEIAERIEQESGVKYGGIDSSLNPGLEEHESIAFAYEKLGIEKFGDQGTLTISAIVTRVLKGLSVKTCGYSGLMLPICEDAGLAARANEETYNISNLLLYSSVCGCGLDVVPIPGDTSTKTVEMIILDTASLAIKLDKPLSIRLLPTPGKKAGEMTDFNSPYMVDCKVLRVN